MAWKGVITNKGNMLLGRWVTGKTMTITKATAGTGRVAEEAMLAQTSLVNEKQAASILSNETLDAGQRIKLQVTPQAAAYSLNQFGVWAELEGEENMIALFQTDTETGVEIPSSADVPDFVYTFYGLLAMDNTGDLKVTIDPSASVTLEVMNEALAKHTDEQTPTFTQAETLTNIASGEKMSVLMGKIGKAIADLISHLKNGNHVPTTEDANNARFLRNDNTWQKVTPANIGAAASSHTHTKSQITDFPTSMTPAAHNQAASTITAGTFAGTVYANRGTDGQTPGQYLVRNNKLASAEENPTTNGEICWTYE